MYDLLGSRLLKKWPIHELSGGIVETDVETETCTKLR